MPALTHHPKVRDIPGSALVASLAVALTALIVVAALAWRSVHELDALNARRTALSEYREAVTSLKLVAQDLVLNARTFAITGDPLAMDAAVSADQASVRALERVRAVGVAVGAPDRATMLAAAFDTASARLLRIRVAGPDAASTAREIARTSGGPALVRTVSAVLDSSIAFVDGERREVAARAESLERQLAGWVPTLALLALALSALAVLLLRAQALARAQDLTRFRAIFDNTFQFIGLLTREGLALEINHTALEFTGLAEDEVLGRPFWTARWWAARPDQAERVREAVARASAGEFVRFPVEILGRDNRTLAIDFSLKPVRGPDGSVAYLVPEGHDITELSATKEALAAAEERWSFALTGSELGVWDWDAQRDHVFYSERWKSMLGFAPGEIGDSFQEWAGRIHPEDLDATMQSLHEHLEGRSPHFVATHRLRAKDGSYRDVTGRGRVVSRGPSGLPLRTIGTMLDITEQRRVEADARRLHEQLSALLRHSPSFISILDAEHRYLHVSQSVATALGRPVEAIIGHRLEDVWPAEQAERFRARLEAVERGGRSLEVDDAAVVQGREQYLRTALFPLRDEYGKAWGVGVVAIDVSEAHAARRKLEAALDENRILRGMLSICAQCKRVRDTDDNQWKPVEAFVQSHSAAVFSHGLCPSCADAFMRENGLEEAG